MLNEVMQDGWNQAPAGVEADELEGNNAANAGHVQGLGAEGNGIDQGLVEAYGIAVEYDEDAMDTDGSNGYAEDDEYDPVRVAQTYAPHGAMFCCVLCVVMC